MANRWIDVIWFLELEEKLALFRQNHFYVSFALPNTEEFFSIPHFHLRG